MHIRWQLKDTQGQVTKKTLPYDSRFLEESELENVYYVGLTADVGMDTKEVSSILKKIITTFQSPKLNWTSSNGDHLVGPEILATSLDSDWYSDSLWILGRDNTNELRVIIEPESDGTEIGVFFQEESDYKDFLKNIQSKL